MSCCSADSIKDRRIDSADVCVQASSMSRRETQLFSIVIPLFGLHEPDLHESRREILLRHAVQRSADAVVDVLQDPRVAPMDVFDLLSVAWKISEYR